MRFSESLLQLRRRQCEERRALRTELERLTEQLLGDAGRLRREIEHVVAAGDQRLVRQLSERLAKLEGSIGTVKSQIAAVNEALAEAEEELRQCEIGAARRGGPTTPASGRRA